MQVQTTPKVALILALESLLACIRSLPGSIPLKSICGLTFLLHIGCFLLHVGFLIVGSNLFGLTEVDSIIPMALQQTSHNSC